jgi:hypothetical protein
LSKLSDPNQKSSNTQHPQHSADTTRQIGQNVSSPIHVVVDASPPTPTPNKERESREERKDGRDKKRYRIEIITAVVLAAYTVVTGFMWWATKKAAEAATQAVEESRKANELSRAIFGTFGVTPQPGLERIAVDLGNSGRAIAIVSSLTIDMTIQNIADDSVIQHENKEWKGPILVQSGFGKWLKSKARGRTTRLAGSRLLSGNCGKTS